MPGYALPAGRPSFNTEYSATGVAVRPATPNGVIGKAKGSSDGQQSPTPAKESQLHQRSNTAYSTTRTLLIPSDPSAAEQGPASPTSEEFQRSIQERGNVVLKRDEEAYLLPGFSPPKYHLLDLFPFSLIVQFLTKEGRVVSGRKGARLRAKLQSTVSHNIPLDISLYLVSLNLDFRTISHSVELLYRYLANPKIYGCPYNQSVLLKLLF